MNTQVQLLAEALHKDDGMHAYILVDPMLREPDCHDLLMGAGCVVHPVPVEKLAQEPGKWPRLYSWPPTATHALAATIEASRAEQLDPVREATDGFVFGGWLLSEASPNELVTHFGRRMQLRRRHDRRYFRWFDRRVLEWMWGVLSPVQQSQLFGPVTAWWSLDRCGQLVQRTATDQSGRGSAHRFNLTEEQWAHAQKGDVVHAMLRGWQRFSGSLPSGYLQRASDAITAAQALGIQGQQDLLLLGAYVLQVHPMLCAHPAIRQLVTHSVQQGLPLSVALGEIPDPDGWDALRTDLESAGRQLLAG